ncbi:MAG TPA: 2-oxo acid dehydrogenase subunit E2 [Acidimicrobiales bacterium]|nr:2-oxo acid dehydrogenase subunit E2 [Acidimicrobiales bacterium]
MGDFKMPSLGADMEVGTVTQWLVKPGDHVTRGDIVAVVDTEKSTIEIEVFESGVVDDLLVGEGEEVAVGTPIARITAAGRAAAAAPAAPAALAEAAPAAPAEAAPAAPGSTEAVPPPVASYVASPVVRHLAEELGVDLSSVPGSAPGGRITRSDVEKAGAARAPTPAGPAPSRPATRPARVPHRPRSSPLARRVAAEAGVDLAALVGSGPGGAVVEADVRRAASAPALSSPAPAARAASPAPAAPGSAAAQAAPAASPAPAAAADRQAAMRHAIGALMARSKREIPHYYLSTTIDMANATSWLERINIERPVSSRLVMPVLMLKAVARAALVVPEMNGFFVDGSFVPSPSVHIGVAVSMRGGGVIAPAIHDVDQLPLEELMQRLRDLVGRTRAGSLRSSEMSDPTITVTNLGDLGVESVFGVIYPPQVALVGFGRVASRPWAEGSMLGVRPCVTATLSADHRASDGHRGGRFLAEIDRLMQKPEEL